MPITFNGILANANGNSYVLAQQSHYIPFFQAALFFLFTIIIFCVFDVLKYELVAERKE